MKPISTTELWRLYEAGRDYKQRIGLFDTVRRNEQFYSGKQWQGGASELPRPVFNLIRRIADYLIGAVAPGPLSIHYTDDRLPFLGTAAQREQVSEALSLLNRHAAYRWTQNRMDELSQRALLEAAITGDGIFYCWWDDSCTCGQPFCGDIRTDVVPNTCFFPADPERADVQSQEWLLLSGRATVESLRQEAAETGHSEAELRRILPDDGDEPGRATLPEGSEKATYLLRFSRDDRGEVVFEKCTRGLVLRSASTGLRHYPFACFNWYPSRGSFHGVSPLTELVPNQRYINSAYAMAMKHMSDTAFSKVIYDKSRIPEWSNEVGEAIAAMGGGNVSDAVSVLGVGRMQEGYLELIDSVIENSKSMMGATESALGDERANNTSAILALQEASRVALRQVEARFARCIGELASVWADMLCAYSPPERLLPVSEDGGVRAHALDYTLLRRELLHATAETGSVDRFTPAATVSLLDRLLELGHITVEQYLEHLPEGCISDKNALLQSIAAERKEKASV